MPSTRPLRSIGLGYLCLLLAAAILAGCTSGGGAPTPLAAIAEPGGATLSADAGAPREQPAVAASPVAASQGNPGAAATLPAAGGTVAGGTVAAGGTAVAGAAPAETRTALADPQAPTAGTAGRIRFTPVIGAPIGAVTPLSRQLGAEARRRGLAVLSSADGSSDNILKGYFSALNDSQNTTVVFVWDVLDNAGNRLYRIQGQEQVPGAAGDPWSAVPEATMERIAERTIEEYLA